MLYGLCLDEAIALILRPDGGRVVSLGKVSDLEAACGAFDPSLGAAEAQARLDALRALLVKPLALEPHVKRVLVSPEGVLCYVPFGALFDAAVCMTPSGTTHASLLEEIRARGKRVLALGAPDYAGASPVRIQTSLWITGGAGQVFQQ